MAVEDGPRLGECAAAVERITVAVGAGARDSCLSMNGTYTYAIPAKLDRWTPTGRRVASVEVDYPWRRQDVLEGLDALAGEPVTRQGADGTVLETAVHAVVDDTGWDLPNLDPAQSIGTILKDEAEAAAIRPVVEAIVRVSGRQGPTSPDSAWFADQDWPSIRRLAAAAALVLRENGL